MKLFLIRHGETDWSRQKRYCGATDISLNKTGKEQAIKLGQRLQQEQIQQIYASNSQRTIQFANLAFPKKTILERAQLQELDFGPWEGLKHHEVESTYPDIYSRWLADPFKVTIGESLNMFIKRIRKVLANIISSQEKTIALVTHGGPLKIILLDLLNRDLKKEFWSIQQDIACLNIFELLPKKIVPVMINDTSYL